MTRARLTIGLSALAFALGLAHLSFLLLGPAGWTADRLWFAGSGLAILTTALLNLVGRHAAGRSLSSLAVIATNLVMGGFFAAAWPVLQGPQVIVGGLLFAGLALLAAMRAAPRDAA